MTRQYAGRAIRLQASKRSCRHGGQDEQAGLWNGPRDHADSQFQIVSLAAAPVVRCLGSQLMWPRSSSSIPVVCVENFGPKSRRKLCKDMFLLCVMSIWTFTFSHFFGNHSSFLMAMLAPLGAPAFPARQLNIKRGEKRL